MSKEVPRADQDAAVSIGKSSGGRGCLMVVCVIFCAIGLGIWVPTFVLPVVRIAAARRWEPVPCVIRAAELETVRGDDGDTYRFKVRYEYVREGKWYEGDRFNFVDVATSARAWKEARLREYPVGAERTCYVHATDASRSVLERGPSRDLWFGLIPLAFLAVGVVGILFASGRWSTSRLRRQQENWKPHSTKRRSEPQSAFARDPSEAGRGAGRDAAESIVLTAKQSPFGRLIATLLFAGFWNGIVWTVVYFMWSDWNAKSFSWFFLLFLIPFILVGLFAIVAVFHSLLALFNPRPVITIQPAEPRLGDSVSVAWQLRGQTHSVRSFKIWLEAKEIAQYQRGTDTYTDDHEFARFPVIETDQPLKMLSGSQQLQIPRRSMHSLDAPHNKIVWTLRVTGDIASWPDIDQAYPIIIRPLAIEHAS